MVTWGIVDILCSVELTSHSPHSPNWVELQFKVSVYKFSLSLYIKTYRSSSLFASQLQQRRAAQVFGMPVPHLHLLPMVPWKYFLLLGDEPSYRGGAYQYTRLSPQNAKDKIDTLTLTVLVTTIDAQWEGMWDVGSMRYEPALLPPCPTIRVLSYCN